MIAATTLALAWQVLAGLALLGLILGGLLYVGWTKLVASERKRGESDQRRDQAEAATADQERAHANLTQERQRGFAALRDRWNARRERRRRLQD